MNNIKEYFTLLAILISTIVVAVIVFYLLSFSVYLILIKLKPKPRNFTRFDVGKFDVISVDRENRVSLVRIHKWRFVKYYKEIALDPSLYYILKDYNEYNFYLFKSSRGFNKVTVERTVKTGKKKYQSSEYYRL